MTSKTAWNPAWDKSIQSPTIDYFIAVGAAVHQLVEAMYFNPRKKLVLENGLMTIWDGNDEIARVGTYAIEPSADDWRQAAIRMGG